MPRLCPFAVCCVMCGLPGLAAGDDPVLVFTEVSASVGINDTSLTESCAWGDYDGDGDEDLYLTNQGPNALYRNEGNGKFTNVTTRAGVGDDGWGVGSGFADLDNDGDLDLYVVNFGGGSDLLYRNNGDATFTDVAFDAGIRNQNSSRGMAFVDFDRDGLLDIYVNAIGRDILYHNLGDLRFEDVAPAMGMTNLGQGVGVVPTDIDGDGWIDLFTGNRSFDPNILYHNVLGEYVDITSDAGITQTGFGMGVLSIDYDNDLDFDLYWTTWPDADNALYENVGGLEFLDVASETGTLDRGGWGISCNAGDVDLDGFEDFFVTNGFDESSTKNMLFRNEGGTVFSDASAALGDLRFDGRGVAFADYDNDGDLDLVVTSDAGLRTRLYRNDTITSNNWIAFRLEGLCGNRSAIGAKIEISTDLGTQIKEVSGGAGRGSFNSLVVEFGLNEATEVQGVLIFWTSGKVQRFGGHQGAQLNQLHNIRENVRADMDGDGDRDTDDFVNFLDAWISRSPTAEMTGSSNPASPMYGFPDGVFDADDYFYYLDAFVTRNCR